ncbi:TonB-dependent receptor [Xanthobacter sp. TB0136]|uniref:TonB-dependent receptor n=1 Tax=Xanthobacter sp. TB0136 TaxID=3459177 RepID=UPI00403A21C7
MSLKFVVPLARGVSMLAILAATPALAQEDDAIAGREGTIVLDAITVTGENMERDMKDTSSSVAVITAEQIRANRTGDSSISQVVNSTPNVVYPDTVSMPVIRGMDSQGPNTGAGAFFAGTVPRATINMDGHYLSYNESYFGAASSWDVQNVEVFRGPQTTSQGANAIAGAIIVNTKDPTFTPEAAYQAEIGSYNSKRVSLAFSGALVKDELAARVALDYSGRDTFINYVNPQFNSQNTDLDFSNLMGRVKLLWTPTNISGFEAKLTYSHNKTNRPSQEAASEPFEDLESMAATMPTWKQHTNTGVLDLKYDFQNGYQILNQTQYSSTSVRRSLNKAYDGNADVDQKNVSNETRLLFGQAEDNLSGVAGLYYANTKSDEKLYLRGTSSFDDTKDNLGIFGEANYRLTEKWTLTGGLRYQQDHVQRVGRSTFTRTPVNYDETFSALLPKVSLSYALTPEWTVGAMVSRGYNPGGVSLNLNSGRWMQFEEETLWDYELFVRANLMDNRLFLNGNIFVMDVKNMQFNIPVVISPGVSQSYTINAEKAKSYGAEMSVDWRIADSLMVQAGVSLLHTEIKEVLDNTDLNGNAFPKSPAVMFNVGAIWDVTDKLNIAGQIRHLAGYYSNVANTPAYRVDPYTVTDLRASYAFNDGFQLYGYVKNLFDVRSATYIQQNRSIAGGIEASMLEPRMLGIGVRGTF